MTTHPMGCSTTGGGPTGGLGIGFATLMIAGLMRQRRSSDPRVDGGDA